MVATEPHGGWCGRMGPWSTQNRTGTTSDGFGWPLAGDRPEESRLCETDA